MAKPHYKIFFILLLLVMIIGCKRNDDKPGCMDTNAVNYDAKATIKMSTCIYVYPWIIRNPSFESYVDAWYPEALGHHVPFGDVYYETTPDGIMPTDGKAYLKVVPHSDIIVTQTLYEPQAHFKGYYFDYRYKAKANNNGEINASIHAISWDKVINETSLSLGGVDSIIVEKKDEYADLNLNLTSHPQFVDISIHAIVTKGTFTFEIDNIRMVQY